MSCLLNEEIMAIRNLMSHLEMAIPLEQDETRKKKLTDMWDECNCELQKRLSRNRDSR